MYGCESWTIKKAERRRIDAFELWCWRRLLRVPWTARRSNQSILKEISPGCSLEGLMLKLKLHYFSHLMRRADSLEKTLMLGKIEGRRRRGQQRMRWVNGITDSMDMRFPWTPGVGDGQGGLACVVHGVSKSQTGLSDWLNWTELNIELWSCVGFRNGVQCSWKRRDRFLIKCSICLHNSSLSSPFTPRLVHLRSFFSHRVKMWMSIKAPVLQTSSCSPFPSTPVHL